jgi:CheY-like chemotaxis protein
MRPLILVVDDMTETRRLMRRVLERSGLRVTEAATGEAGLRAAARDRPSLIVLDLRLPGISGFDVARRLRAHPDRDLASTPILACSASVQPEVIREALEAGCDAFEGKPFEIATFADLIQGMISQRAAG